MSGRRDASALRRLALILIAGIFLVMLLMMTLQGLWMYLYLRFWLHWDEARMPQFWRPIPFLIVGSAVLGSAIAALLSRIPLKPIRELINAINELANGNFHARVHLNTTREFERLSESFNRMAQELENTEILRSDFINNFSHEFKTPIVSLRGFARILKNSSLSPQERDEYLDIIIYESNRLSQLATNVLNLSKVEKLSILTDLSLFDLSEEIRRQVLLLQPKWQKKELELIIDMEEISFYGSRDLLNQAWINLIDNAVKFSPQRGKIKLKLHKLGEEIQFSILDNGCGMSPEVQAHIFERFYQGDHSHTTEGNGIGLAVVKKIVELHSGRIRVHSEAGIGTTFSVLLPVKKV